MTELRDWLLHLARETMQQEGAADASHDYDHIVRVAALAFHDLGQERERRHGGDHALIGAAMAGDLLTATQFPQHSIAAVQQAIREHRMTGNQLPQSLEGRILYDADKIDCLGAIGIGRLYCITGRYNQKIYSPVPADVVEPVDPLTVRLLRRRLDYAPSIEFQLLFGDLPRRMTTSTGRELAAERYTYMQGFFTRLRQEIEGEL